MNSSDKLEFLERLYSLSVHGIKLGLRNITVLLDRIGNPQDSFRCVHVAGTDGKGSVCAMIESVLRTSGLRTGLYTSPHLVDFNERIAVGGVPISDGELEDCASEVMPAVDAMAAEGMMCTFFEAVTAMAFLHFKRSGVEFAVVEVGMGGRFDATNVVVPELSVIMNISLEHTEYLGDTIGKIAYEKAGIVKDGIPVVTMNTGEALDVIVGVAKERNAPVTTVDESSVIIESIVPGRMIFSFGGNRFETSLVGRFQAVNAATAILSTRMLGISESSIAEGIRDVRWPARLQKVDGMPLILDVTHTAAGAKVMAGCVAEMCGKVTVVFGVLGDKDVPSIAETLSGIASKIVVTEPRTERAMPRDKVADIVRRFTDAVEVADDVPSAVQRALDIRGDGMVLVTGSLFMAGEVMSWLRTSARYSI